MSVARVGDDATRLAALEDRIEQGRFEVGAALAEIRNERLYLSTHSSFEAYCNDRWSFSPRRANQLIAAAAVVGTIVPGCPAPENEAQARALAAAPPEERADVMAAVAGKGKPTAAAIADEIEARHPAPEPSPPAPAAPAGNPSPAPPPPVAPMPVEAEPECESCEGPGPLYGGLCDPCRLQAERGERTPTKPKEKAPSEKAWEPAKALAKGLRTMPTAREVMEVLPADSVEEFDRLADEALAWGKRWKEERKAAQRLRLMGVK